MSILIDRETTVICQGFTGRQATAHCAALVAYGTRLVGGVSPGKGGSAHLGLPVFDTVQAAAEALHPRATLIMVPPAAACDAILEAADAELELIVCITEGIPVMDLVKIHACLRARPRTRLIGPNCPGIITPGECHIGIMPPGIFTPGPVGIVSRSGTLTYEAVSAATAAGFGQSTCVGIGGDALPGTDFAAVLRMFEADPATLAVVLVGEIGGTAEQAAAAVIAAEMTKPVIACVVGRAAPAGRRMGHAGAVITGPDSGAAAKAAALSAAGAVVVPTICDLPAGLRRARVNASAAAPRAST